MSNDEFYEEEEDTLLNKYLTFHLAEEDYAVAIEFVIDIIGIQRITNIPDTEKFVKGVINLRGKVIPVIDVRLRFRMKEKEYGNRTCIIIVNIKETAVGLIVDQVSEVLDIMPDKIDPPPTTGKKTKSKFIQGMGKVGDSVKIILNIEKLLFEEEIESLKEIS